MTGWKKDAKGKEELLSYVSSPDEQVAFQQGC